MTPKGKAKTKEVVKGSKVEALPSWPWLPSPRWMAFGMAWVAWCLVNGWWMVGEWLVNGWDIPVKWLIMQNPKPVGFPQVMEIYDFRSNSWLRFFISIWMGILSTPKSHGKSQNFPLFTLENTISPFLDRPKLHGYVYIYICIYTHTFIPSNSDYIPINIHYWWYPPCLQSSVLPRRQVGTEPILQGLALCRNIQTCARQVKRRWVWVKTHGICWFSSQICW